MTSISDHEQDVTRADGQRQAEEQILGYVGSTLDDRYEILSLLGKGGMSVVYKARHLLLDRLVAVKMLLKGSVASHESLQRFQYEAKAISQLQHPNIIQFYAFNASEVGVYLVMDYLEGISLDEILREEKRVPMDRALPLFKQAAAALEHAHLHGIVHRDLKPSNIMLVHDSETEKDDVVKLVDFGIAKLIPHEGEQVQQLTRAGAVFGTPAYMSPEQCTGRPLDARSDIYSFGSVMFEVIVGQPPLEGETPLATMYLQLKEKPPLLSEAMPGHEVSIDLERIIDKCLEKDPDNRFQTMSEVVAALDTIRRDSTTVVRISQQKPARKKRPHRAFNFAIFAVVVILTGAGGWLLVNFDDLQIDYYNKVIADKNSTLDQAIEAHHNLVTVLDKHNRKGEVVQHLVSLAEISDLPDVPAPMIDRFTAWVEAADYMNKVGWNDDGRAFKQVVKLGKELAMADPANNIVHDRLLRVIEARVKVSSAQNVEEQVIDLATVYNDRKQPQKAQRLIALVPVPEKEDLAVKYLITSGAVDVNLRKFTDAIRSFGDAIKSSRNDHARANIALNAATMFGAAGEYEQALTFTDQALQSAQKAQPRSYLDEMVILETKGHFLLGLHRGPEARKACEEALAAWKKSRVPEANLYFVKLLLTLGNAQFETGQYERAAKTFAHRFEILLHVRTTREMAKTVAKDKLLTLRSLGASLTKLNAWSDAAQVYQRVLLFDRLLVSPDRALEDSEVRHDLEHCKQAYEKARQAGQRNSTWRDIEKKYMPNLQR